MSDDVIDVKSTFDKYHDDEFLEHERIPAMIVTRRDLNAFLMLNKLSPSTSDIVSGASHDEIWLDVDMEELAKNATDNDILTLVRCGVMYDEENDCLHMFV